MGIFNIFNKKSDNESAATVSLPVVEPSDVKEKLQVLHLSRKRLRQETSL